MAIGFNETQGGAKKNSFEQLELKLGENKVRLVGGICPRYVYWVEGTNNKKVPIECLAFNRETETFDNAEEDVVQQMYPDLKCSWAYAIMCIDLADGKMKVFNLKRKLFDQILGLAKKLGDPTDPENGWDIIFEKKKTGPHAFNVEYTADPFGCQEGKRPLTDEERAIVEDAPKIDDVITRQTPDTQRKFLERLMKATDEGADPTDDKVEDEFDVE